MKILPGFNHGGWVTSLADEAFGEEISKIFNEPFDLLLGRKTYIKVVNGVGPGQPVDIIIKTL